LQTLRCVPLGSDVGCAYGKNIDCAYRKARVRFACCAREWLCSLPGRNWCCCLTVLHAPPALLLLLPSALVRRLRLMQAASIPFFFHCQRHKDNPISKQARIALPVHVAH
jgi:ABC-type enterobactin transport system permease subunit